MSGPDWNLDISICLGVGFWFLGFTNSLDSISEFPALEAAFEILDRLSDAFLELDLRFPTKYLLRASDVRLPHFGIVHR
jgi:hypothetical protein